MRDYVITQTLPLPNSGRGFTPPCPVRYIYTYARHSLDDKADCSTLEPST